MKTINNNNFNPFSFSDYKAELDSLFQNALQTNSLPYNNMSLCPENKNLISGESLCSLNAEKLELSAAKLKDNRTLWIFAADAELLNLTLNNNAKHIILYAETGKTAKKTLDAQSAYLIGHFTEHSIERVYKMTNPLFTEGSAEHKTKLQYMASQFIGNIREYDNDLSSLPTREAYALNAASNNKEGAIGKTKALYAFTKLTSKLSDEQKYFFNNIRLKFRKQFTDKTIPGIKDNINIPESPHTLILKARLFALRMSLPDFGLTPTMPRISNFEAQKLPQRTQRNQKNKEHSL